MKNKNLIFIFINLIVVAISVAVILLTYQSLPPTVPFFYSLPWGEGQLAPKSFLFAIPSISLLFFAANTVFLKLFKIPKTEENERKIVFIHESLVFVSFSCAIINLITVVKIVRLFI